MIVYAVMVALGEMTALYPVNGESNACVLASFRILTRLATHRRLRTLRQPLCRPLTRLCAGMGASPHPFLSSHLAHPSACLQNYWYNWAISPSPLPPPSILPLTLPRLRSNPNRNRRRRTRPRLLASRRRNQRRGVDHHLLHRYYGFQLYGRWGVWRGRVLVSPFISPPKDRG